MSRQQQRAAEREAVKAKTRKAPVSKKPDSTPPILDPVKRYKAEDLNDRQAAGALLARDVTDLHVQRIDVTAEHATYLSSGKRRSWQTVTLHDFNDRGTMTMRYECSCEDYHKLGRHGCKHTFAERILRNEVIVLGEISAARAKSVKARRRPARDRKTHDGRPVKSSQSKARQDFEMNLPRLVVSLVKAHEKAEREERARHIDPDADKIIRFPGGQPTPPVVKAAALLYKIAYGKTAEQMQAQYAYLIERGFLRLKSVPHPNTISDWMNDPTVTPILEKWIPMTAYAFRRREIGAIIDSSKISQMRTAHHRGVEYLKDDRPGAEWMRCHALIGVETMVCMAVRFGGNRGLGKTHDTKFVKPLVSEAIKQFNLQYLLADKAYFGEPLVKWLWDEAGIKAVIPTKKRVEARTRTEIYDPYVEMIMWCDQNEGRDFHEVYRLRPKIEGFFSLLKRVAQGYFSAKGRPRRGPDGVLQYEPMADGPCTAWQNEALCKFIFMNLRTTTRLEDETGQIIDYLIPERCFPPPAEPLLQEFRAA